MLYKIQNGQISPAGTEDIEQRAIYAGLITMEELGNCAEVLGFAPNTIAECTQEVGVSGRSMLDNYENYSFGIVNIVNVGEVFTKRDRIGVYIKRNLFLLVDIIDEDKSTKEVFKYALERYRPENITIEKLIYAFFERIIYSDSKYLERYESIISAMEDEALRGVPDKSFNSRMLRLKKELLAINSYYEQLLDISEALQEDANEMFADTTIAFKLFADKVGRLCGNTRRLRDSLVQLREAYQAAMDLNINNKMKLLTVMASVFMPLTLIVGWYGMNFTAMPEIAWKYGYIFVILLSLATVTGCLIYFKKRNMFK